MGGWVGVEIIRIKAVLSSTRLELELELSLAKKVVCLGVVIILANTKSESLKPLNT